MDAPSDLIGVPPMKQMPDPPTPNESRQVYWWRAYCDATSSRYWIENGHGKVLAEGSDWAKLCADLGWFPGHKIIRTRPRHYHSTVKPAQCDDRLDPILAAGQRPVGLHKPKQPMAQRPIPPDEGAWVEILGYRVTRRTMRSDPKIQRTFYYAYDGNDEIVSFAEDWNRWCHVLNWFPLDDLEAGEAIPRTAAPASEPKPKVRTVPAVLNRHHYKTRDEIPEPWVYVGRGHALGNPFVVVNDPDDPEIKSALAEDPKSGRSSVDAISRYKRWLWEKISKRDPAALAALGKITAQTHLVCSCAPRPCHADVIVRAWKWASGRTVLDGYTKDEAEPDWAWTGSDATPEPASTDLPATSSSVDPSSSPPAASPASPRPEPQNLSLFGEA